MNNPSHSFTLKSNGGLLNSTVTPCKVGRAFNVADGLSNNTILDFNAIWDTGATGSVITQKIVDDCDLKPISMTEVRGVHGAQLSEVFLVNIVLPNSVMFENVKVTKAKLLGDGIDALIGMDIISQGDFSFTNKGGLSMFSFRIPSAAHTDYVEQHNKKHSASRVKKDRKKSPKTFGKNKRK